MSDNPLIPVILLKARFFRVKKKQQQQQQQQKNKAKTKRTFSEINIMCPGALFWKVPATFRFCAIPSSRNKPGFFAG